jgi:internalin A
MDISPFAQLSNLSILELWANEIRDISPISEMTSLTELNLGQNPLSDDSVNIYIPQLESRGVDVSW